MAYPNINELYLILTKVASGSDFRGFLRGTHPKQEKNTVTYGELSRIYKEITNQQVDPQFGWTKALNDLNKLVVLSGRPQIFSVVVCGDNKSEDKAFLPGDGFWASFGTTAPSDPQKRQEYWLGLLKAVREAKWPLFQEIAKDPRVVEHFLKLKSKK